MANLQTLPVTLVGSISSGSVSTETFYNNSGSTYNGYGYTFRVIINVENTFNSDDRITPNPYVYNANHITPGMWFGQSNGLAYRIEQITSLNSDTQVELILKDVGLFNLLSDQFFSGNNTPIEGNNGIIFNISEDGDPIIAGINALSPLLSGASYWINDFYARFQYRNLVSTFYSNNDTNLVYSTGYTVGQVVYLDSTGTFQLVDVTNATQVEKSFGVITTVNEPEDGNMTVKPFGNITGGLTLTGFSIGDVLYYDATAINTSFVTNIKPADAYPLYIKVTNTTGSFIGGQSTGSGGGTGTSGSSGSSGTSGSNGSSGTSGTDGQAGTSGTSGTSGTNGQAGSSGSSGTSGSDGSSGISGVDGSSGTSGSDGSSGISGSDGSSGTSGSDGSSGTSGNSGDRYSTTSSTNLTISNISGYSINFTGGTGLAYTIAQDIVLASDASNYMVLHIVSYNSVTGAFSTTVEKGYGSGNYSSWTINLNGAVGFNGTSGTDGSSGTSGLSGTNGSSGTSGSDGSSGTSGSDGSSGTSGSDGSSGTSGSDGSSGTSGSDGSSGTSGSDGSSGTSGSDGSSGTSGQNGTSGSSGSSGISGLDGTAGSSGTSGSSGSSGTAGTSGSSGSSGTTGTSGSSGSSGTSGSNGSSGTSGSDGSSGTSGSDGSSGTSGSDGSSGTSGSDGSSGTSGSDGSSGTSGSDGSSGTSGSDGSSGSSGTSGTSGSSGSSGISGTNGSSGTSGQDGSSGTSGSSGRSAQYLGHSTDTINLSTLTIGDNFTGTTSTDLDYSIAQHLLVAFSNTEHFHGDVVSYDINTGVLVLKITDITGTGTHSTWTTNVDGAAGGNGTSGTSGTSGQNGSSGTSGSDGSSGTSGSDGSSGTSGSDGSSGTNGSDGSSGTSGSDGSSGTSGSDGSSGTSGSDGSSGTSGSDGSSGTSGSDGSSGTSGSDGSSGTSGSDGSSGTSGSDGSSGTSGSDGSSGTSGSDGSSGTSGSDGSSGTSGSDGSSGTSGNGFTIQGTWDYGSTYNPYDVVSFNGSSYVANRLNTNSAPPSGNWDLLASSGSNGVSGSSGSSGISGVDGSSGTSGISGTNGSSGSSGSSGTSGDSLFISGAGYYYTTNNLEVTGSVKIKGTLTADEYNVRLVSSSILYSSGSTKFGDTQDDTHVFTGSLTTTGSVVINGDLTVNGTSIMKAIDNRESLIVSGAMNIVSNQVNASIVSASLAFESVKVIEQVLNSTIMDLGYF